VTEAESRSDGLTEEEQADWVALVEERCSGSPGVPSDGRLGDLWAARRPVLPAYFLQVWHYRPARAGRRDGFLDGLLAAARRERLPVGDYLLLEAD